MPRRNITILVSFTLLAILLSLSVSADVHAFANSSSAYAWASGSGSYYISASASIRNLLDFDGGVEEGNITYAYASGSASNLYNVEYYPVTSARASSWDGFDDAFKYWPN